MNDYDHDEQHRYLTQGFVPSEADDSPEALTYWELEDFEDLLPSG